MTGSRDRYSPAPTRRVGHDRRRSSFPSTRRTLLGIVVVAVTAIGCVGVGPGPADRAGVAPGPIGPILAAVDGKGPPIECRGLSQDRCLRAGSVEGAVGGVDMANVERVIVSCEGTPCTAAGGAVRIDLLLRDGTTVDVARGGYGEFRQP